MKQRILALCLAMLMVLSVALPREASTAKADDFDGYVYFTVERITLGQGFVIEPVKAGFYEEDTLADITERVLGDMSTYEGDMASYYLEGVVDGGEPEGWTVNDIPEKILNAAGGVDKITGRSVENTLSSYDYFGMAGWITSLNDNGLWAGAGSYKYNDSTYAYTDGDVVRLQFSVYGYGQDTNTWDPSWGSDPLIAFPNKDELIKAAADYNGNKSDEVYVNAINVLKDWDASEEEISNALDAFNAEEESSEPETEIESEEETGDVPPYENTLSDQSEAVRAAVLKYIQSTVKEPVISYAGGDWAVLDLARGDVADEDWYTVYYENAVKTVEEKGSSKLHNSRGTENSRAIIALTSIGADPENVAGYNLLEPLGDADFVEKQGLSGVIYALIAFDTNNYDIPQNSDSERQTTREGLLSYILANELENGGWTLYGSVAEPDVTAMVIQALAPYYNTDAAVKAAVDKALIVLSDAQDSDGGYTSWGTSSSENCSQIVCALCALGINPDTDSRFVKNGNSVLDALLSFFDASTGVFRHALDGEADQMATEQAAYALDSYFRLVNNKNRLYDMSDSGVLYRVNQEESSESEEQTTESTETTTESGEQPTEKQTEAVTDGTTEAIAPSQSGGDVNTGDSSSTAVYIILMMLAGCTALVLLNEKRRVNKN